ncbi:T4SS effector SidA family protein [Legionella fallonii]|nr:T4SS effector SidA family protein [Legionella fallonii]
MTKIKKEIHAVILKDTPVIKQIHQGSAVLSSIASGIANYVHLLANIFSASKDIPVISFFVQMFAMLPKSIEIITDPKKSIAEKVLSTIFLVTIVSLSVAAFVVGSLFAAIVGTVLASVVALMEGLGLIGKIVEKYQASAAYTKKVAFNDLIDLRKSPENTQFNELFEARAVELKEAIKKKHLSKEEKEGLHEELHFIEEVLQKKNISLGQDEKNTAFKLQSLYRERERQLEKLINKISALKSTSSSINALSDDIQTLQSEILQTDEQINKITVTAEQLNAENMIATEKSLLSISNFGVATAGVLLSVIGLIIAVSSVVMPPVILGALVGVGIGLAAVSLGKFITEKIIEHQEAEEKEEKETMQKETILEEALFEYEYQLQSQMKPSLTSSHSQHMQELITKEPSQTTSPTQDKTVHVPLPAVNYGHPVFKKPLRTPIEQNKEQDVTPTQKATSP